MRKRRHIDWKREATPYELRRIAKLKAELSELRQELWRAKGRPYARAYYRQMVKKNRRYRNEGHRAEIRQG